MVKGISVKFESYNETIPKILKVIRFDNELKKHSKIILKPSLRTGIDGMSTKVSFVEPILKFCMENKNPGAEIFIAEGADGMPTEEVFEELGYKKLAEKYGIGLVDLNDAETEYIESPHFLRFDGINYPKIMKDSFVISLPALRSDEESEMEGSLSNFLGAYPSSHYKGLFSKTKSKIRKWPIKYSIHDILKCKSPDFAMIDASDKGVILAGQPLEMDKQAAKLLGLDWKSVQHIRLVDESTSMEDNKKREDIE